MDVVELRRYRVHPGRRDELIEIFDREFIESQEACGMVPVGHYRDLDNDDSFVWFRGFPRFEDRAKALHAFYIESKAWRNNRDAANATMIDSDNVLLLRNAREDSGFDLNALVRPSKNARTTAAPSYVAVSILMVDQPVSEPWLVAFEEERLPALRSVASRISYFVTEQRANDFPRLPVREGEWAFVVAGICATHHDVERWTGIMAGAPSETLRLEPAPRSLWR